MASVYCKRLKNPPQASELKTSRVKHANKEKREGDTQIENCEQLSLHTLIQNPYQSGQSLSRGDGLREYVFEGRQVKMAVIVTLTKYHLQSM